MNAATSTGRAQTTAHHGPSFFAVAVAAFALCGAVRAQFTAIAGRSERAVSIGGLGKLLASISPLQASAFDIKRLARTDLGRISELTRLDAQWGNASHEAGHQSIVRVRAFTLGKRLKFRSDGLLRCVEMAILLGNKSEREILPRLRSLLKVRAHHRCCISGATGASAVTGPSALASRFSS